MMVSSSPPLLDGNSKILFHFEKWYLRHSFPSYSQAETCRYNLWSPPIKASFPWSLICNPNTDAIEGWRPTRTRVITTLVSSLTFHLLIEWMFAADETKTWNSVKRNAVILHLLHYWLVRYRARKILSVLRQEILENQQTKKFTYA